MSVLKLSFNRNNVDPFSKEPFLNRFLDFSILLQIISTISNINNISLFLTWGL